MKIKLISATDLNGAIGLKNKLPWRMPSDLGFFKEKTLNQVIVMGSKTKDGIPGLLPMREHWVITSKVRSDENITFFDSIEAVIEEATARNIEEIWIVGGASIYEQFLPFATHLYLTIIDAVVEADTYFPQWDRNQFELKSKNTLEPHLKDEFSGIVYEWARK